MQGTHETTGGYVDTIDMNIREVHDDKKFKSVLRLASRSNIHGALGDHGQNYKNNAFLAFKLYPSYTEEDIDIAYGCGKDNPTPL